MSVKKLNCITELQGNIYPIEFNDIPFDVKRVFYVTNVPQFEERGFHAHYETEQILICIQGKINIKLYNGKKYKNYIIFPGESIYVGKLIWDSQQYLTGNDILMSLCSTAYNINDYVIDFTQYQKIIGEINEKN